MSKKLVENNTEIAESIVDVKCGQPIKKVKKTKTSIDSSKKNVKPKPKSPKQNKEYLEINQPKEEPTTPLNDDILLEIYVNSMDEPEKTGMEIAKKMLGSSFSLIESNGFQNYKKSLKSS